MYGGIVDKYLHNLLSDDNYMKSTRKHLRQYKNQTDGHREMSGDEVFENWYGAQDHHTDYLDAKDRSTQERLQKEILTKINDSINVKQSKSVYFRYKLWSSGIAASFLMLLAVAFFSYFTKETTVQFATNNGELREVVLPDGSKVILNSRSRLTYKGQFNNKPREVWLEGQGIFYVTHKSNDRSFIVHLSDTTHIKVLGTTFNVVSRGDKKHVVLKEGSITLAEPSGSITLDPGEGLVYDDASQSFRLMDHVNMEAHFGWEEQKLYLQHTDLNEMICFLKESYDINASVKDTALLNRSASGTLPLNISREQMTSNISMLYAIDLNWKADTLMFSDQPHSRE